MSTHILIIGLKDTDSGKTSLARATLSYLQENDYRCSGFKPFSGNNIWYNFDFITHTLSEGRVYSRDVSLLKQQIDCNFSEEVLNPIHRIWNEPAIVDPATHLPNFIVDRITISNADTQQHILLFNKHNEKQLPKKYRTALFEQAYTTHRVDTVQSFNRSVQNYYQRALEQNFQTVQNTADVIVIESYADQAFFPWKGLDHFDAVFAIQPWRILCYDPDKYLKALQLSQKMNSWEIATQKIVELLKPVKTVSLKPVSSKNLTSYLVEKVDSILCW